MNAEASLADSLPFVRGPATRTTDVVATWRRLISGMSLGLAAQSLRDLYASGQPAEAELIYSAACEFVCQHCIYPPDFARHNSTLHVDDWRRMTASLHADLDINRFVYSGRSMTRGGAKFLVQARQDFPDAALGLIDTGISMAPFLDLLKEAQLSWIDVSFDGTPEAHDLQRQREGSFEAGLMGAREVSRRQLALRLNVLTCLTAINLATVRAMTRFLNREGFKNFFRSPIATVPGAGPNEALALSPAAIADAAVDSLDAASELHDAYVELGIFDAAQFAAIVSRPEFGAATLVPHDDHVAWVMERGTTTVSVRFWPASLTGLREFIVNSDGRALLPKSMAWGRIPEDMVIGQLLRESAGEIWQRLPESEAFNSFVKELETERRMLGELLG